MLEPVAILLYGFRDFLSMQKVLVLLSHLRNEKKIKMDIALCLDIANQKYNKIRFVCFLQKKSNAYK